MALLLGFAGTYVFSFASTAKETHTKPYKATTIDECIEEKECVWYSFSRMLQISTRRGKPRPEQTISKRDSPLKITIVSEEKKYNEVLNNFVENVSPLFPYAIEISVKESPSDKTYITDSNSYIFFTDDIERSYVKHVGFADDLYYFHLKERKLIYSHVRKEYAAIYPENGKPSDCSKTSLFNPKSSNILATYSYISTENSDALKCFSMVLYSNLGLTGRLDFIPFSIFSSEYKSLTELDRFLIFLLYQPAFKSGYDHKKVKAVFDDVFVGVRNKFLAME